MMKEEDLLVFKEFAAKLHESFPDARIWAFGSRARGDAEPDSDLDTCVVVPVYSSEIRQRIGHIAWEVGFEREVIISTVVFQSDQFERRTHIIDPLVKNILREGIAA